MPSAAYDAVLFDFGGVIVESPFERLVEGIEAQGASADVVLELVFGPYHEDTDHPWHRAERGELSVADYFVDLGRRVAAAGLSLDLPVLFRPLTGLAPRPHVVELIRELHTAGTRMAMVTNNIPEGRSQWEEHAPLECFELVVDSSAVGMRKPAAEIYELAVGRLGVEPARAVFVDDVVSNVEGAARVGLAGVHVSGDARDAVAEIRSLLGARRAQ